MLDEIVNSLEANCNESGFYAKTTDSYENLKISVKDFGELKFPISATVAKKLIKVAIPAEFGWKDKTLYDYKVRKNWKISGENITIGEKKWNQTLNKVLQEMQKQLGLEKESKLSAELHDMLVYEPGDFFSGHKDSEKAEGMVGTLVILLPSDFKGGSLVVQQQKEKKVFQRPRNCHDKLTFIAFYADCFHEVKKVTSGYRVTLTYNLILKNKANLPQKSNDRLLESAKCYFETDDKPHRLSYRNNEPKWLVYLLDHEYSEKNLNWTLLKGADRGRGSMFMDIAQKLDLNIHLVLADVHESWNAQYNDYYERNSYRRNNRWHDEDENDDYDDENIDVKKEDLIDDHYELHYWINGNGENVPLSNHGIDSSMMCCTKENDAISPFKSEYEGWMGNYGNTIDYWYHRAAIVLWKKDDEYSSLFSISPAKTLEKIKSVLQKDSKKGKAILEKIIPQWSYRVRQDVSGFSNTLDILAMIKNEELAATLLDVFLLENVCKSSQESFIKTLASYGQSWGICLLEKLSKKHSHGVVLLKDLLSLTQSLKNDFPELVLWMLQYQFSSLKKEDRELLKRSDREIQKKMTTRAEDIKEFLLSVCDLNNQDMHIEATDYFLENNNVYSPEILSNLLIEVHVSWDKEMAKKWNYDKWFAEVEKRLQKKIMLKREKGDWSIKERVFCNCVDCQILRSFLENDSENLYTWPLAQQRRRHIHNVIDSMGIPVTHETERKGSPHKLILTKTPKLFEDSKKEHNKLLDEIEKLQKFKKKILKKKWTKTFEI